MSDYLASFTFIGLMALFYLVVISRYGVFARKLRAWEAEREDMRRDLAQSGPITIDRSSSPDAYNGARCSTHEQPPGAARDRR